MVAVASESLNLDGLARVGLALADDSRRRVLVRLTDGPAYPSELADVLGLSRTNVSNHLACLRWCGFVTAERRGKRVFYRVADARVSEIVALTRTLLDGNADHVAQFKLKRAS